MEKLTRRVLIEKQPFRYVEYNRERFLVSSIVSLYDFEMFNKTIDNEGIPFVDITFPSFTGDWDNISKNLDMNRVDHKNCRAEDYYVVIQQGTKSGCLMKKSKCKFVKNHV
jgi:hypothetical protein